MIHLEQVTSLYPGTHNGLKNFSCKFTPGVYALLGKNGSGKTTLFRHLVGALFPQQGKCHIFDESPARRNPDLLKEIFLIPEEPFFPNITTTDYLRGLSPFYPHFDDSLFKELLIRWEVPQEDQEKRGGKGVRLRQMSQGQKKKFLIAFALASQTQIMLFDEPTNGLDITSKVSFKNLGKELFHPKKTFIFATHQIKDVENLIDHITLIDEGSCWGNYSLKNLKAKLFTQISSREDKTALFSLPTQGGYIHLKEVGKKPAGNKGLDLEIFFTAFLQNPLKFKELITHE